MSSGIEFTHFIEMQKTKNALARRLCRRKLFLEIQKSKTLKRHQPRLEVNLQSNHQVRKQVGVAWHRLSRQGSRQNVPGRILLATAIELKQKQNQHSGSVTPLGHRPGEFDYEIILKDVVRFYSV